jgi:hypothetical protein
MRPIAWVTAATLGLLLAEGAAQARCPDASTLAVGDPCKTYGEDDGGSWSSDGFPFVATLGFRSLSYAPQAGTTFDGNVETSPLAYQFPATQLGSGLRTYGIEASIAWIPVRWAYIGIEAGTGMGQWTPPAFTANSLGITSRGTLDASVTDYAGLVGLRLPLGAVSLRGEMAVGGSSVSIDQYATNGSNQLTSTASATVLLLEPRAWLDVWATPTLTVSLMGAMPGLSPSAMDAGLVMAIHTRVFDGG